ncbi:MAG: hypothetical protein EOO15_03760 [Chitinophagaceae bacterium]|nr:MAG: hypothetical protein EOO15_03760 [Chitinophagaceae bacterium]
MLYAAITLFAIAALLGIVILKNWLTSADTGRGVVYAHGLFAALGLGLLLYQWSKEPSALLRNSLVLFGLAALGGFYMFFRDLKGKFSPTWLAVVHGLLAVAGFGLLVYSLM